MASHLPHALFIRHVLIAMCFAGLLFFYYASTVPSSSYYSVLLVASSVLILEFAYGIKKLRDLISAQDTSRCTHNALCQTLSTNPLNIHHDHSANKILAVISYAFFARYFKTSTVSSTNQFSSVKTANRSDVYWMVALSQLPTLPLIHFFVEKEANAPVAWLVTALTLWSVVYYLAQVYGVKHISTSVADGVLNYRFGFTWSANIPITTIKSVKRLSFRDSQNIKDCFMTPFGSNRNLLLEFEQPVTFNAYYGSNKKCTSAIVAIDRPDALLSHISSIKAGL